MSSEDEYLAKLKDLSHGIRSSYTVVIVVTALLFILLLVFGYFTFMEEWTKWKRYKQGPKKAKLAVVEKSYRRKKRRAAKSSKTSSKSSKSSTRKRSKPKAAPVAAAEPKSLKKNETAIAPVEKKIGEEPKSKKESASKLSTDVNAASTSPPHVRFALGIKDNSSLMSAKKYQSVETKYPSASTLPQAPAVTPSMTVPADVSPSSKQLHSSKCPGTGSFGTSLVSTFPTASASNTSLNQMKDAIIPPTMESSAPAAAAVVVGTGKEAAPAPPKIYKPHEVPSPFASDGAVTAREETEQQVSQTQSPRTMTSSVTDVTPMATSATQSTPSVSFTQGITGEATANASKTSLVGNATTAAESIPSSKASSLLAVNETTTAQSDKTSTPKK